MHPGYESIDDSDIPAEASVPVRDASPRYDCDAADNVPWLTFQIEVEDRPCHMPRMSKLQPG